MQVFKVKADVSGNEVWINEAQVTHMEEETVDGDTQVEFYFSGSDKTVTVKGKLEELRGSYVQ